MARDTPTTEININFNENLVWDYFDPEYPKFEIVYTMQNEKGDLDYYDNSWHCVDKEDMIEYINSGLVERKIQEQLEEEYKVVKVVLSYIDNKMYDGEEVQILYDITY